MFSFKVKWGSKMTNILRVPKMKSSRMVDDYTYLRPFRERPASRLVHSLQMAENGKLVKLFKSLNFSKRST